MHNEHMICADSNDCLKHELPWGERKCEVYSNVKLLVAVIVS